MALRACLSTVALYGKGILELSMTSLVEEVQCAKSSLEMTITVKNTAPTVKTEKTWNP